MIFDYAAECKLNERGLTGRILLDGEDVTDWCVVEADTDAGEITTLLGRGRGPRVVFLEDDEPIHETYNGRVSVDLVPLRA